MYDIIIIGAGPAGLTAGIYAGRQGSKTLILEKNIAGGKGLEVPLMENYPGYEKIQGQELIQKIKKQATKLVELKELEEVIKIKKENMKFTVETKKDTYTTRTIILATGTRHRRLKIPGEKEFLGRGVSYCATCDGPLYKGKEILVIGGGNSAVQEAIFLKQIGCKPSIVHRRDELRAQKYLQDRAKKLKIPIIWNTTLKEIKGKGKVQKAVLENRKTGQTETIKVDGIFIAIGEEPINKLAQDLGVKLDKAGYIITDKQQRTSVEGVYAAGDITGGLNQWITACAEGAIAATSAQRDTQ
ncbi:MAG TPA: thioredoxin-disulfide reductase [Methanothermobacter sp.]|jgi:thioredoxin reductase (NADPH)|uniref:Thioredoxin-disulfide reductase n=1 Tax=Methanothermobacter tenebrarum TaxID=680118 RepID=A0ABM7YDN2_9EURY|nr:thioredoxin-disulfide reductase [Methanothermobacter tenebrarum]MDD3454144.1 thioredoxin-disulfide reductase [Methanobacteriales archaeon]MDI6881312.1 thioredoxin-disulfide reductase [Methanothermobacter sp.]MDX9693154.1 thioredoxin-disulfide reductase [Methanothermobacter sp.]BDH79587.1 thioredoxin-disulfide reductase [Methanothermobacter tenebrarum]HHW15849.1 thioredoxin-disulfide reductase [Methanothermobacter sp.]